jgi:IS1 family transposase
MARESRLMLEVVVGPRTQESATKLVEGIARWPAADCWPLWSSDGWEPYLFALTLVFAVLIHFIKGKWSGRPKESQVVSEPRVRYEQVIKQRVKGRLVAVSRRVVFGVEELIPLKQISTSLLERLNGTARQHVAPLHRKTRAFAKRRTSLDT